MLLKQYPSSLINRLEAEISPNEIIRSDENSNEVTELLFSGLPVCCFGFLIHVSFCLAPNQLVTISSPPLPLDTCLAQTLEVHYTRQAA